MPLGSTKKSYVRSSFLEISTTPDCRGHRITRYVKDATALRNLASTRALAPSRTFFTAISLCAMVSAASRATQGTVQRMERRKGGNEPRFFTKGPEWWSGPTISGGQIRTNQRL